jgi:hypothetical protein
MIMIIIFFNFNILFDKKKKKNLKIYSLFTKIFLAEMTHIE